MAKDTIAELNDRLSHHMRIIERCTVPSARYGRLLLASPPDTRYPYIYPRDSGCAMRLFRRLATSTHGYDSGKPAFELMKNMARFMKDAQSRAGSWGQRYAVDGEDKSIYKQEDNVAHGIAILCNYLLTARELGRDIDGLDAYLDAIDRALDYSLKHLYQRELHLFQSTTAIHESAMESGYTCWVNFAFLYAFSLAHEVASALDDHGRISKAYLDLHSSFLYTVNELFITGGRYVRRICPTGDSDYRPDFTLLSPFYFGVLGDKAELDASVSFLEKQLWDAELGLIMRYLPFYQDFAVHLHAGNGPWLQYSAILAQYHYWNGNTARGDDLLRLIDSYSNDRGEIPEHLSTSNRFDWFMEKEWLPGHDFSKEFHKPILLDDVGFDKILEEANNMARSYEITANACTVRDPSMPQGGYVQFAMPLMWAHTEYARALLVKAKDWQ